MEHENSPTHLFIHPAFDYSLHVDRVLQSFGEVFPAINNKRRKERKENILVFMSTDKNDDVERNTKKKKKLSMLHI